MPSAHPLAGAAPLRGGARLARDHARVAAVRAPGCQQQTPEEPSERQPPKHAVHQPAHTRGYYGYLSGQRRFTDRLARPRRRTEAVVGCPTGGERARRAFITG
jgi:hypothetical protein